MLAFYVATYSPGDGVTRYRFFDEEPCDYFEGYGFKEALANAQGRRDGYFSRKEIVHNETHRDSWQIN